MNVNSSSNDTLSGENIYFGVAYLTVSVLVMMSNGVVVGVIFKSRELHMPTLWLIAFMAIWDFATGGLFLLTATPSAFLDYFPYPESLIPVVACVLAFTGTQNISNMCMVVVDRYIAISFPMKYPRIAVQRNYFLLVILSLTLTTCHLLIIIFTAAKFYFNTTIWFPFVDQGPLLVSNIVSILPLIQFVAVVVLSIPVYKNIRRAHKQIAQQGEQSMSNMSVHKFPMMVLLSAAVYCISYVPVTVAVFWNVIHGVENKNLFRFGFLSWLSNSLWNVFIYVKTYKPFKLAFTRLFCKAYHRRQRQTSMLHIIQNNGH